MSRGMGGVALNLGVESHSINPAAAFGPAENLFGIISVRSRFSDLPSVAWDTNQDGLVTESDTPLQPGNHSPSVDLFVLGAHVPLTERISLGVNCIVPTNRYFRVTSYEPSLPVWVMYRNRAERFDIRIGAGADVWRGLRLGWGGMIGYAVDLDLTGTLSANSVETESDTPSVNLDLDIHEMEMAFNPRFIPSLSAFWSLGELHPFLDGTSLGLNYRFESSAPLKADLDFQINVALEDIGDLSSMALALMAPFQLDIHDQFIPAQLSVGTAWQNETMSINADMKYTQWSSMHLHVIEIGTQALTTPLAELDIQMTDGNGHELTLRDTMAWSAGFNSKLPLKYRLWELDTSLGAAFTPHTLERIGSNISPLDTNRMTYAMGLRGSRNFPSIRQRVSFSLFGQLHHLLSAELLVDYDTPLTPGAPVGTNTIPMSGIMGAVGTQLTFGAM